mgnify:CR=1 FL=1
MKTFYFLFFLAFIMNLYVISQQTNLLSGNINTAYRIGLRDGEWLWNENKINIFLNKNFEERAKIKSEIWFRNLSFNENELQIREAKVEIYDFLFKNVDLTIGRQRIKWGTADKLNHTDNINSYDFEDVFDFGKHLSSDAIRIKYYNEKFNIDYVLELNHKDYKMPLGKYASIFETNFNFPDSFLVNASIQQNDLIIPLPPFYVRSYVNNVFLHLDKSNLNVFKNSISNGLKVSTHIKGIDFSISYLYSYYHFPIPSFTNITLDSFIIGNENNAYLTINTNLIYPRFHFIGFDLSTSIKDVGLWFELCNFVPNKEYKNVYNLSESKDMLNNLGLPPNTNIIFSTNLPEDSLIFRPKDFWTKFVIGTDYSFKNNIYVNIQYSRGFIFEQLNKNLNNYILFSLEKRLLEDKLKIQPINMCFCFKELDLINKKFTMIWFPEILYFPNINTEISLSASIIEGEGDLIFNRLKDLKSVNFRIKFSF